MTVWSEFKTPTDGPYPVGNVRVGSLKLPIRVAVLKGGVVLPIPWEPETETRFREWFTLFARRKGWPTNPDHDRYEIDWRAAWWSGLRALREDLLKVQDGTKAPASKIEVFAR